MCHPSTGHRRQGTFDEWTGGCHVGQSLPARVAIRVCPICRPCAFIGRGRREAREILTGPGNVWTVYGQGPDPYNVVGTFESMTSPLGATPPPPPARMIVSASG